MSKDLEVTDVKFVKNPKQGDSTLIGFATITLNNALTQSGYKVFENDNGIEIGPPANLGKGGKWFPTVKFERTYIRKAIEEQIKKQITAKVEASKGTT